MLVHITATVGNIHGDTKRYSVYAQPVALSRRNCCSLEYHLAAGVSPCTAYPSDQLRVAAITARSSEGANGAGQGMCVEKGHLYHGSQCATVIPPPTGLAAGYMSNMWYGRTHPPAPSMPLTLRTWRPVRKLFSTITCTANSQSCEWITFR